MMLLMGVDRFLHTETVFTLGVAAEGREELFEGGAVVGVLPHHLNDDIRISSVHRRR